MIKIKEGFKGERIALVSPYVREQLITDPFLSTLYITDIGYYPHAEHHYVKRTEPLNQYVLLYCVNGYGSFSIGKKGTRTAIHEDSYVILPAGEPHEYCTDEDCPWTIYWVHFGGTLASYYAKDAGVVQSVKPNIESRINNRISIFEEILTLMQAEPGEEELHYASSLLHHFLASLRYLHAYRDATGRTVITSEAEAARHYIEENIERCPTLKQIAKYVGLSVSNLSMKFRKAMGCSPKAYMNKAKMERARILLSTTDMQVSQISFKLGIIDPLYFSRLFKSHTGMSPSKYRHLKKEGGERKDG